MGLGGVGGRTIIYIIKLLVFHSVFVCLFFLFLFFVVSSCNVYQLCLQISYVVLKQFETGVIFC